MPQASPDANHPLREREQLRERAGLVRRPRLEARLADVRKARATLIHAPAGYGKTSLVLQWLEALRADGVKAAYISLTPGLGASLDFLTHLVAAVDGQTIQHLPPIRSFLAGETGLSAELLARRIVDRIGEAGDTVVLLFDDVQYLNGTEASGCLRMLIDAAPPSLHIVLAAREKPDVPLARLKAHGQLCEIAPEDLRFHGSEVTELMARCGVDDLNESELAILELRSEGWAVGLRLAALALAARPDRAEILRDFLGDRADIWDYFVQDVLAGQSDELQDFLLKSSILDRLSAPLCDAVTGRSDSRALLDHCVQAGLFLFPLDEQRNWYRFHPLFRSFLMRAFDERFPGGHTELHVRASNWFHDAELYVDAFDQALQARDPMGAAAILDSRLDTMFGNGEARVIERLVARLPRNVQALYPRILLAACWPMSVHWRFAEVRDVLATCRVRLAEMQRLNLATPAELEATQSLLQHREMMLAQFSDDMAGVEAIGGKLIDNYPGATPFVSGSMYSACFHSKREHYKFSQLDRYDAAATAHLQRCESPQVFISHDAIVGTARFQMGETDAAIARLRGGMGICSRLYGRGASLGAICALPLAEALYERDEREAARALLEEYLPVSTELGLVDQLISGWLTQSRLLRSEGDTEGALRVLTTASAFAAHSGFERLALFVADERVHQLRRAGRPDEAMRAARRAGVKPAASPPIPSGKATTRDEARASLWVSCQEMYDRRGDALNVARQWRSFTAGAGALRQAVRWNIRIAHLLRLDGDFRGAKRMLLRAIEMAEPCDFRRSFLDEAELFETLLPAGRRESEMASSRLTSFVASLHVALGHDGQRKSAQRIAAEIEPAGLDGNLTKHELQVLKLAASGLTNREVGERLGMTEGSTKWHLQQIYDKIGVRRRLQAVERARQLGLIA